MSATARKMLGGVAVLALLLIGALTLIPKAEADHCRWTGGAPVCVGDPRNPHHQGEERIAGDNRYHTAVAISQQFWAPGEAERVYLANGWSSIDALAAGPSVDGPILLVGDTLPGVVAGELERLAPTVAVVALGGDSVVAPDVLAAAAVAAGFGQP